MGKKRLAWLLSFILALGLLPELSFAAKVHNGRAGETEAVVTRAEWLKELETVFGLDRKSVV